MNSMKLVIPLHFTAWKKTPNDAVTPRRQSQFTPKTKANAVPRLLSSLVWIDQYNECNGMTSFMEFMKVVLQPLREVIWLLIPKNKHSSFKNLDKFTVYCKSRTWLKRCLVALAQRSQWQSGNQVSKLEKRKGWKVFGRNKVETYQEGDSVLTNTSVLTIDTIN